MKANKKTVTFPLTLLMIFSFLLSGCNEKTLQDVRTPTPDSTAGYNQINQEEAMNMMKEDENLIIVDVRTKEEFDEAHIPDAVNIPNTTIKTEQPEQLPDLEQHILVYCRNDSCSKAAAKKLAQIGYTHIYIFDGIDHWKGELIKNTDTPKIQEQDFDIAPFFGTWISESGNLTLRVFKGSGFILTMEDDEPIQGHLEFTEEDRGLWASGPRYELIDLQGEVVYGNAFVTKDPEKSGEITLAYGGGAERLKEECPVSIAFIYDGSAMELYNSFVADEGNYAEMSMLVSNRDLKNFKIVRLTLKSISQDGHTDFISEPLYEQDVLAFNAPLLLQMIFSENIPSYGFSYTDDDGTVHLYGLSLSGRDDSIYVAEIE